jgi:mannose-6-phosphate isomerase-like protein (cupin superfamily)
MIKKNILKEPYQLEQSCHGGKGTVLFRRILENEFQSKVSFLDYTVLPPGTSIGYHLHPDTEEVYVILSGTGTMTVDDETTCVVRGDVILNRKGGSHGLANDGPDDLEILVFEGQF